MNENESERSFGELPTFGRDGEESPSAWEPGSVPSWMSEAETLRPAEGIRDDGRTDAARRWKPGEVILDRYVVEGELGQGGMGVVYACLDRVGGVRVAVKCLPPELSHNSVEMEEVRENFRLVCGLAHPNIAVVRHLERDARGEYFLVMDVAEGESLRKWLRRKWKAGGVGLAEAVGILRQMASALDYAHGEKVIHRDVKPGNVMIDGKGRVKVLDFGLAAQIRTSLSRASQAYRGTSGTGPYMAPEQWRGRPQDGKTDQYALGVMAYEMLAGKLPFENSEMSVLREVVLKEEVMEIPGVSKVAMGALRRSMAKRREERFGSCGEFVDALLGERGGGGGRRSARGKTLMGWVAPLVLATGVGAGVWWWMESGGGTVRLEGAENAVEETARPVDSPHQQIVEEAKKAEEVEQRLPEAEKARQADEIARQKAEEEAKRGCRELEKRPAKREQQVIPPMTREVVPPKGSPRQGDTKTIMLPGGATMEMVWCPPGSFMMGSPSGEPSRAVDETQLRVTLTEGFWMAKTEVTQKQWESVMETTVRQQRDKVHSSFPLAGEGDDYPIYYVRWDEAQEFCRKAGHGLQLPTEAQWEYACRAGSETAYSWGNALNGDEANCDGRYPCGTPMKGPYKNKTTPVGSYKTNAWGFCDMHGNVWEWCLDRFGDDSTKSEPIHSWLNNNAGTGVRHVLRGGSWSNEARFCRSAYRGGNTEDYRDDCTGFRPACLQP